MNATPSLRPFSPVPNPLSYSGTSPPSDAATPPPSQPAGALPQKITPLWTLLQPPLSRNLWLIASGLRVYSRQKKYCALVSVDVADIPTSARSGFVSDLTSRLGALPILIVVVVVVVVVVIKDPDHAGIQGTGCLPHHVWWYESCCRSCCVIAWFDIGGGGVITSLLRCYFLWCTSPPLITALRGNTRQNSQ